MAPVANSPLMSCGLCKFVTGCKYSDEKVICHRYHRPPWQICRRSQGHQQSLKLLNSLLWLTSLLYLISCCCWCFWCCWDTAVVVFLSLLDVSAIFGVHDMAGFPSVCDTHAVVRVGYCWGPAVVYICSGRLLWCGVLAIFNIHAVVCILQLTPVANLPPVSVNWHRRSMKSPERSDRRCRWLIPVLHPALRSFEKIWTDPNVIIRGLGEDDSWNKSEAKNLVKLSLLIYDYLYQLFDSWNFHSILLKNEHVYLPSERVQSWRWAGREGDSTVR